MANPQMVMIDGVWRPLKTTENEPAKECCCAGPEECCLYPPDRYEVEYPYEDLPPAINVIYDSGAAPPGLEMVKTLSIPGLGVSGYFRGTEPLAGGEWAFIPSGSNWEFYVYNDVLGWVLEASQGCLIINDGVIKSYDQFPDTLSVDGDPVYELFRVNLCFWAGEQVTEDDTFIVHLEYVLSPYPGVDFYGNPFPTKPFWLFTYGVGSLDQQFAKDDPQDGPVGTYGMGAITVS